MYRKNETKCLMKSQFLTEIQIELLSKILVGIGTRKMDTEYASAFREDFTALHTPLWSTFLLCQPQKQDFRK